MNNLPEQTNVQINTDSTKKSGNSGVKAVAVILAVVFCLFTAGLGLYGFFLTDRDFSESENRVLSHKPVLTREGILNGSYMKEVESYLSDQFPFRDGAISLKTFTDRIMGKREENGVYIGSDGFLFDFPAEYIKADNKKKLEVIDNFCNKYKGARQMLVLSPNSSYIYKELLPYNVQLPDQNKQINSIFRSLKSESLIKLNATDSLLEAKKGGTQLFYKTDHHWTTRAAFSVFESISSQWGIKTKNYSFYPVTADFEGTLSGKAGISGTKDIIEICVPENAEGTYTVNYESKQLKTATLFDESKLNQKNKYEIFVGGNFDKVAIDTVRQNEMSLLIVKDSYANCMIPMLTPYFSKIVIVDPRYLTDSISAIMQETDFTHILFLYNLNTFLTDTSIVPAFSED